MSDYPEKQIEQAAKQALENEPLSESVTYGLSEARKLALARAAELQQGGKANVLLFPRQYKKIFWSGAVAASVTAIALTVVLKQPTAALPFETADSLLFLTEMDETDWQVVQDLEFTLWLSELSDDQLTTDPTI